MDNIEVTISDDIGRIVASLPAVEAEAAALREILLANLVMVGEVPAPTFREQYRIGFLVQRFSECGLQNVSTDEIGNGFGIIPGSNGGQNILVISHADTVFSENDNHTISVEPNCVTGPGVANNSLGCAVLVSLPTLLERLNLQFRSNIILMGGCRSLGRGNLEGLRFFLSNNTLPIRAGICIEGVTLGRLSFASVGMLRGEISCNVPEEFDWTKFGATNAIIVLNDVISKIEEIPLPKKPRTTIIIGSIEGGTTYNTIPTHAELRFEVRSESAGKVREISQRLEEIVSEVATHTGADVSIDTFANRRQGGLKFTHPLARHTRSIMKAVGIQPRVAPSVSELAALITAGIPAITIGITNGENLNELNESVQIEPMFKGIAQLVAILQAIDEGYCDED